ncbi:MAG: redox-regulated ATPase YchF [Planctomycetota bacterium]
MSLRIGIVGLPNVGKSTLFNALTQASAAVSNYPFTTIEKNVGVVAVPDPRLERLRAVLHPQETIPATLRFTDIAGLVKGASKGEGLGNKFLGHIREVDALVHVVRCFEDANVVHVDGSVDPLRDIGVVETELALADLDHVADLLDARRRKLRGGEQGLAALVDLLEHVREWVGTGKAVRTMPLSKEQRNELRALGLVSDKPVVYIANIHEDDPQRELWRERLAPATAGAPVLLLAVRFEAECMTLEPEDRELFMKEAGLHESGLAQLARAGVALLDLVTFYTIANEKLQAWHVPRGTTASRAAGSIHSDMEAGFIRAEVASLDALEAAGSWHALRGAGKLRSEGKDHPVQDGDVLHIHFKAPGH